jgi:hypothetical protein
MTVIFNADSTVSVFAGLQCASDHDIAMADVTHASRKAGCRIDLGLGPLEEPYPQT